MTYQITLDLPEVVFREAQKKAGEKHQPLEAILVDALMVYLLKDSLVNEYLETEVGKRALIAGSIESADWWDAEGDREWDSWQP
ncbi:hypothetical protein FJZ31_09250 [Candidatus Poribacteria bacterium]|nr:hypothetical protein [Candidatus Poribacteria bacterium]